MADLLDNKIIIKTKRTITHIKVSLCMADLLDNKIIIKTQEKFMTTERI